MNNRFKTGVIAFKSREFGFVHLPLLSRQNVKPDCPILNPFEMVPIAMLSPPWIPFEKQRDTPAMRMCGAAALSMVYRSFGIDCEQEEVGSRITTPNHAKVACASTKRIAKDARERGLFALILSARDPWQLLSRCREGQVRTILNHRVTATSIAGHYSVLVDLDEESVTLHDPLAGPSRRLSKADLLRLWLPLGRRSEITGNVLIAIAKRPFAQSSCTKCERPLEQLTACRRCNAELLLQPSNVLGCLEPSCPERTWARLFCIECDKAHTTLSELGS